MECCRVILQYKLYGKLALEHSLIKTKKEWTIGAGCRRSNTTCNKLTTKAVIPVSRQHSSTFTNYVPSFREETSWQSPKPRSYLGSIIVMYSTRGSLLKTTQKLHPMQKAAACVLVGTTGSPLAASSFLCPIQSDGCYFVAWPWGI